MKDLFSVSLFDVTPQNIAQDNTVSNIIKSIDPDLLLTSKAIHENLLLPRIDELDDKTLDLLAWQLHVDFYDLAGTLKMKRDSVKNSILWHMKKGTEWAIHEALRQLGISADFHPWYEHNGVPYTFKLDAIVTDDYYRRAPDNRITENIRRAVEEAKSARSFMADLRTTIEINDADNLYVGFVSHKIIFAELGLGVDTLHELLILFEQRIYARFEQHERNLELMIDEKNKELKADIEELKDLLKWRNY